MTTDVSKETILLVTKNPEFQRSVYNVLNKLGFRINSTEASGRNLKSLIDTLMPGLVIVDMEPLTEAVKMVLHIHARVKTSTILLCLQQGGKGFRKLNLDVPGYTSSAFSADELAAWVEGIIQRHSNDN